jgi:hypothetical protein
MQKLKNKNIMKRTIGNSNTNEYNRLVRSLNHGAKQLEHVNAKVKMFSTVGKTYYLLKDLTMINFRQWNMSGKPDYLTTGCYDDCLEDKNKILKHRKQYGLK